MAKAGISLVSALILVSIFLGLMLSPLVSALSYSGSPAVSGDDGYVSGQGSTYIRSGTGADGKVAYNTTIDMKIGQDYVNPDYFRYRTFLKFNTSSIPAGATVTSAKLCLNITVDASVTDFIIGVQIWTGTIPIDTTDYTERDGSWYDDNSATTLGLTLKAYKNITISNTACIIKAGYTMLCVMSRREGTSPTGLESVSADAWDMGQGISILEVTYTTNVAPTIGAASGTNWDDIDNCYAQKKTYTVSVTYTDTDGFADIHYCELYLKTGGNVTRATFQFHEDDNSWSTPAGSTEWTLIGYSNASAGNNIVVVWGFQAQWDATEENALDFLFFVTDTAGASVNSLSGTPFDVVTRLVTESFTSADPRINLAGTTTISGTVYYGNNPASDTNSSSYPPDAEFTQIDIHDVGDNVVGTDNVIVNGYFSTSFAIPNAVQSNTYHAYINLADADGTDQDALDGDTTAVVGDRVKVYYFQSNDTRTNINEYVNLTVKAELEFDAHPLGAVDSLSFNATTLVWNGASFYNDSQSQAATGNWTFAIDAASEATFGITAYTTNVTLPWVVWDNLTATNLQPVQYQGSGTYKYDVRLTYGFDGSAIVGGYMALEYPNGTKAGECVTNATGYAGFILDQLNATNGVLKLYGLNETAYEITTAGVNLTFTIRLWTLVPQDVSGNSLTNTNHNVTLGATVVWNGTATAVYVPPDTFNVTVTWLQDLVVNSTVNVVIAGDTTTGLNCTCYPYVIGVTRYWAASNGTITSSVYGSYLLTVKFSCALNSYVLVASYTTRPSYVLNVTYNMTIVFASGYLVLPHFGNATIVVSYENWAGLYVKYTDRTMWSAGWAGQRLDIVLNGTIGDSGELDVNCGSKGMPVSDSGFTFTSYVGGVFTGLYTFTDTSATVSLEWTPASTGGGTTGQPQAPDLFITLAFTFPKNVQSGTTVDGFLNVSWMGAATVYIWGVVVESDYASDWELQISRLPWTLETLMQDGRTQVPVVLYITGTLAAGNYSVPCDVTFHTVEGVSKTVRSIITFEVSTPIAEVPSTLVYVFLIGLGLVVTSGLFLGTQKRRKYSQ